MIEREQLALPCAPNEVWSIDFVMDALSNGRVKCLTVVDDFTKEAVDIVVDHGISGLYVARALDRAARRIGLGRICRLQQLHDVVRRRKLHRHLESDGVGS